jgi:hypothetical protein
LLSCGDEKSAERRFKLLINQSKHLPLIIKNFINRLEDNWERATILYAV